MDAYWYSVRVYATRPTSEYMARVSPHCTVVAIPGKPLKSRASVDLISKERTGMETQRYDIGMVARIPDSRVAYIDDRPMFVQAAEACCICGIHHTDCNSTRAKVAALGLEFVDSGKEDL